MAISARNESLNACNACLDAANVERNGIGTLPATLLMKTIFPVFRWTIDGSMAARPPRRRRNREKKREKIWKFIHFKYFWWVNDPHWFRSINNFGSAFSIQYMTRWTWNGAEWLKVTCLAVKMKKDEKKKNWNGSVWLVLVASNKQNKKNETKI